MKNKFKIGLLLAASMLANSSFAAGGAQLTGVKGTLKNVERAIKAAVAKAEEMYEQNGGVALTAPLSLLTNSTGANPFLQTLSIDTTYNIKIQFSGTFGGASFYESAPSAGSNAAVPVTQALLGSKIYLVGVYSSGDAVINSWECLTDADQNAKAFIGDKVAAIEGNTSMISLNGNPGDNEYLSNCIFVATSSVGF